ncbi:MAG: hydrolase [Pseudomonadota bacterium]
MLIKASDSCLTIIDVQTKLLASMHAPEKAVENTRKLLLGAQCFDVPCLITEQNSGRLGPTAPELNIPEGFPRHDKMHFAAMQDDGIAKSFKLLGRKQVILTGLEAHICILQTAAGLIEQDYDVFVVADAVMTRAPSSLELALARLREYGANITTTEMVLFEWLERSNRSEFKDILQLIK